MFLFFVIWIIFLLASINEIFKGNYWLIILFAIYTVIIIVVAIYALINNKNKTIGSHDNNKNKNVTNKDMQNLVYYDMTHKNKY